MENTGNRNSTNDLARTYRALKDNIMRTLNVCTICKVINVSTHYSKCQPINKPQTIIQCFNGTSVSENDYVVVVFTDEDTRGNLDRIVKGEEPVETTDGIRHDINYGIIISKLNIGE